jgi:type II secretory pathway pseudopilin PulG
VSPAVAQGASHHGAPRGNTLVELTIVMLVMSVLTAMGAPRFMRALEQSRVDVAAANLRAIWTAQRLYWLKHQTYAPDLGSLISDADGENFLDPHVSSPNATYICEVTLPTAAQPSATDFTATATRPGWTGSLSISIDGSIPETDQVVDPSGTAYKPSPSFQ